MSKHESRNGKKMIEAVRFTGSNFDEVAEFVTGQHGIPITPGTGRLWASMNGRNTSVTKGEWIAIDENGARVVSDEFMVENYIVGNRTPPNPVKPARKAAPKNAGKKAETRRRMPKPESLDDEVEDEIEDDQEPVDETLADVDDDEVDDRPKKRTPVKVDQRPTASVVIPFQGDVLEIEYGNPPTESEIDDMENAFQSAIRILRKKVR